ncbi:gfo/Idh/MocA family oxidoreductase [Paenibacillus sp. HJL G12]|uniref:Gfo/Idh/MocA family oxidoreductase n=1 Tax=Paenibacillus dendrobii TaxID=2691084 RepID=A0A7X3ILP8_9BACL|nr:Gfo/Idh/MocA family oxidoreductase [Paenibacillus dendrobii]MWV46272.1 gfo/Idh/MocA family oxidoreductase [Paenibacillus dendrobii]
MTKLRLAVIGLGHMGKHMIHRWIPQFAGQVELAALCDNEEDRLHREAEAAGGSPKLYTDYRTMLEEVQLDLVYIAVPPSMHYDVARIAFQKGIHVFCEKPLANNLEEAKHLMELGEQSGRLHAIHFSFPLDPEVLKLKELIDEQAVGPIKSMNLYLEFPQWPRAWQHNPWITTRHEGGYLLEVGIHWIHMIQQVFGPITQVMSEIEYPTDGRQCESRVRAIMRLHNNIDIHVSGTDHRVGEERVSLVVHGEKGTVALENWSNLYMGATEAEMSPVPPAEEEGRLPIFKQVLRILNGEPGQIYDFCDGYNAQVVLEALRKPGEGFTDIRAQLLQAAYK